MIISNHYLQARAKKLSDGTYVTGYFARYYEHYYIFQHYDNDTELGAWHTYEIDKDTLEVCYGLDDGNGSPIYNKSTIKVVKTG